VKQETLIAMSGIPVVYGGEEVKDDISLVDTRTFGAITAATAPAKPAQA
jgi:hypothetical protein